jgi:peptidoglycan-associated lipoprotein
MSEGGLTMGKKFMVMAYILMFITLPLMVMSCAKKGIQTNQATSEDGTLDAEVIEDDNVIGDINAEGTLTEEEMASQEQEKKALAVKEEFVDENIYFEFDSATLTIEAQEILRKKAHWLEKNPDVVIVIEGHCDNRGTEAYNLALGERRAESAKAFLTDLGIDVTKIMTISYGEERPINPDDTEEAWANNRRASFVIQ